MEFSFCHYADRSRHYNEQAAKQDAKWSGRLQVQMKSQLFRLMYSLSNIVIRHAFQITCDNEGVQERAKMGMDRSLLKNSICSSCSTPLFEDQIFA